MLTQEPTAEIVREWQKIHREYAGTLRPNRRSGPEVVEYLLSRYPAVEETDPKLRQVVIDNVLNNEHDAMKLPEGAVPKAAVYSIPDTGTGKPLYAQQDAVFQGIPILVGVELVTGFFLVEGSSLLWDELLAFRGLDTDDLTNFYLTAEYVGCLQRFGKL